MLRARSAPIWYVHRDHPDPVTGGRDRAGLGTREARRTGEPNHHVFQTHTREDRDSIPSRLAVSGNGIPASSKLVAEQFQEGIVSKLGLLQANHIRPPFIQPRQKTRYALLDRVDVPGRESHRPRRWYPGFGLYAAALVIRVGWLDLGRRTRLLSRQRPGARVQAAQRAAQRGLGRPGNRLAQVDEFHSGFCPQSIPRRCRLCLHPPVAARASISAPQSAWFRRKLPALVLWARPRPQQSPRVGPATDGAEAARTPTSLLGFEAATASSVEGLLAPRRPSAAVDGDLVDALVVGIQRSHSGCSSISARTRTSRPVSTIHWEAAYATAYHIEVSNGRDHSDSSVYDTTTGSGGTENVSLHGGAQAVATCA